MTSFKRFGTPPAEPISTLITIEDGTREEMDRAMLGYLRQGLSPDRAMSCVAASVMFQVARDAGMVEGVDYTWMDGETSMSSRMAEWLKDFSGEQHWNHMEMVGFITKAQPEPEPDVAHTPMGYARVVLLNAKDPDANSKKAHAACIGLLKSIGLSASDAESKLQRYLNGDESLEELLELIEERVAALREEKGRYQAMTSEQQNTKQTTAEDDERFLPASSPWLAHHFKNAATLLGELQEATDLSDFAPNCISNEALASFIDRLETAWIALPDESDEDQDPPLELVDLCRALSMLTGFLELEQSRRKYDQEYAAECKGANEVKRYFDAHNGQWPPSMLGGKVDG